MFDFPWWIWVLIVLTLVVINYVKLKVFSSMKKKKPSNINDKED